jgi:hypothetical protein
MRDGRESLWENCLKAPYNWPLVATGYAQRSTPRGTISVSYVLVTYVANEIAGATIFERYDR